MQRQTREKLHRLAGCAGGQSAGIGKEVLHVHGVDSGFQHFVFRLGNINAGQLFYTGQIDFTYSFALETVRLIQKRLRRPLPDLSRQKLPEPLCALWNT